MRPHDELDLSRNLALANTVFHKELVKKEDNGLKMLNEARLETLAVGAFPIRMARSPALIFEIKCTHEMETLNSFPFMLAGEPALIPL